MSFDRGQERAQYLEKKAARLTPSLGSLLHVGKPLSQRLGKDTSDFFHTAQPQLAAAAEQSLAYNAFQHVEVYAMVEEAYYSGGGIAKEKLENILTKSKRTQEDPLL